MGNLISDKFKSWQAECEQRFERLKRNEEELNKIFIDIYGLQDELAPDVADKDITVHRVFDNKEDIPDSMRGSNYVRTMRDEIVSLISYAVGCMFGRYSLDKEGLCYAGGDFGELFVVAGDGGKIDGHKSRGYLKEVAIGGDTGSHFGVDADNIIPITDDEYFMDDIVSRFAEFVSVVYGADTLETNLKFVADALGGKGTPRDVIRNYFLNDFYADHLKTYQKRPIYWLFSSGKKNGFKCLIYMHRYQTDTIARIRTDYVHELQSRYSTAISNIESRITESLGSEAVKLRKQLKKLQEQNEELYRYEEKIHHLADQMITIDLDDGVKVNYAKFGDALAAVK